VFHFLIEEAALRLVGSGNDLRRRRRVFVRAFTHSGLRTALNNVRLANVESSVEEALRSASVPAGAVASPLWVQNIAKAFLDAQGKREDADYNLNEPLSEADARLLQSRVSRAIAAWRAANTASDRDFKHALCMLLLLKGQIRRET
jgi:cytochrome P450